MDARARHGSAGSLEPRQLGLRALAGPDGYRDQWHPALAGPGAPGPVAPDQWHPALAGKRAVAARALADQPPVAPGGSRWISGPVAPGGSETTPRK